MGHYRCQRLLYLLLVIVANTLPSPAEEALPAKQYSGDPNGIKGKLLICGGGELPEVLTNLFMLHAGGKSARIVVVPTAQSDVTATEIVSLEENLGETRCYVGQSAAYSRSQNGRQR